MATPSSDPAGFARQLAFQCQYSDEREYHEQCNQLNESRPDALRRCWTHAGPYCESSPYHHQDSKSGFRPRTRRCHLAISRMDRPCRRMPLSVDLRRGYSASIFVVIQWKCKLVLPLAEGGIDLLCFN